MFAEKIYLFWVYKLRCNTKTDFPAALVEILTDERVRKVGSCIHVDVKNLMDDFGIEVKNAVSLGPICKQAGFIRDARASLLRMAIAVLGRKLDKSDGSPRYSSWSGASLSAKQKHYAARDAKASLSIYEKAKDRAANAPFGTIMLEENPGPSPTSSHATVSPRDHLPLTRVLLDAFHAMKRITDAAPKLHSSHLKFVRALRDAIFKVHPEDQQRVSDYLATKRKTFDDVYTNNPDSILCYLRRKIPDPEALEEALQQLIEEFQKESYNDPQTDKPIVTEAVLEQVDNLLKHVRKGCLSDPEGIPLYYQVGTKNGLPVYRCARGTSDVEGAVHSKLIKKLTMWNAGPRLGDALLAILRDRFNIRASERFRDNFMKTGHYAHWLYDDLRDLTQRLYGEPSFTWWPATTTSPNPDEVFGIVPCFPPDHPDYEENVCMDIVATYTPSIRFLAIRTHATIPFLPVKTPEECWLYACVVSRYIPHGAMKSAAIDYERFAEDWNNGRLQVGRQRFKPDGRTILKKLPINLQSHFGDFYSGLLTRNITRINAQSLRNLHEILRDAANISLEDMEPAIPTEVTHTCSVEQSLLWSARACVTSLALAAVGEATNIEVSTSEILSVAGSTASRQHSADAVGAPAFRMPPASTGTSVPTIAARPVQAPAVPRQANAAAAPPLQPNASAAPLPQPTNPQRTQLRPTNPQQTQLRPMNPQQTRLQPVPPVARVPQTMVPGAIVPNANSHPSLVSLAGRLAAIGPLPLQLQSPFRPPLQLQFMAPVQTMMSAPRPLTHLPISSTQTAMVATGRTNRRCLTCGRAPVQPDGQPGCSGGLSYRECSHPNNPLPGFPKPPSRTRT